MIAPPTRKEVFARVLAGDPASPQVIRVARGLAAFLREKELTVAQDDLLAGGLDRFDYSLPPGEGTRPEWPECGALPDDPRERRLVERLRSGARAGLYGLYMGGHVIAGYRRVLDRGFGALAGDARAQGSGGGGREQHFAAASAIVCDAARDYAVRYAAEAAAQAGQATGEQRREHLAHIAAACRWVATQPPRTFFEAVQLLWLTHEILICEQPAASMSLGPVDQYLHPFYARDLASGDITPAEASRLIDALWSKLGALRGSFQNVVLGGARPDGTYSANDVSRMCLQASGRLGNDQPLLCVRWHPGMPDGFWKEVQQLIETGMGFPALFNDQVAVDAKRRLGVSEDDVWDYGLVGCVELSIPGKEFSHTEVLRVNWAKVLELMLSGGVCSLTGEGIGLGTPRRLGGLESFEQFLQWYKDELTRAVDLGIEAVNHLDREFPHHTPYPFLSSTMDGCLEVGRDVTAGGTVYNLTSVNGCGMADAVDSLVALRQIAFEDGKASLPAVAEAVRGNFSGAGHALRALMKDCPKYGNDLDGPDGLMRDLMDHFCAAVEKHRNPRGGRFQVGMYTVAWHAELGKRTGALPSGRPARQALANGMSPSQGCDVSGPTATINSTTRLDHRRLGNGMVLDLKFDPSFFADEKRRLAFRNLVETYFGLGGMEIQFNVVGRDTLLAAQRSPESYRDLLVRVSGFSAHFTDLDTTCQDEIIARTDHASAF